MSFEDTNAVRHSAELLDFPSEFIIRPQPGCRGDQIALTQRGVTAIFDTGEDFYEAIRRTDPQRLAIEAQDARTLERVRHLVVAAKADRSAARHARAQAERMLQLVGWGGLIALALVAVLVVTS